MSGSQALDKQLFTEHLEKVWKVGDNCEQWMRTSRIGLLIIIQSLGSLGSQLYRQNITKQVTGTYKMIVAVLVKTIKLEICIEIF